MVARKSWVGIAFAAMFASVVALLAVDTSSAQTDSLPSLPKPPTAREGPAPGRGGIGGQIGGGLITGQGDYSAGAQARFSFTGHWRYVMTPWIRWQISPGFMWAGYDENEPAPYRDLNFPDDSTKAEYLTNLVPVSAQLQFTHKRGPWLYYAGAGPGVYRVWIENRRKVLKDPQTFKLHHGL
jgi:hypothetical protein